MTTVLHPVKQGFFSLYCLCLLWWNPECPQIHIHQLQWVKHTHTHTHTHGGISVWVMLSAKCQSHTEQASGEETWNGSSKYFLNQIASSQSESQNEPEEESRTTRLSACANAQHHPECALKPQTIFTVMNNNSTWLHTCKTNVIIVLSSLPMNITLPKSDMQTQTHSLLHLIYILILFLSYL